jgi:hypothetical protein
VRCSRMKRASMRDVNSCRRGGGGGEEGRGEGHNWVRVSAYAHVCVCANATTHPTPAVHTPHCDVRPKPQAPSPRPDRVYSDSGLGLRVQT